MLTCRLSEALPRPLNQPVDRSMLAPRREANLQRCVSCATRTSAMQPSYLVAMSLLASNALEGASSAQFVDYHTMIS